MSVGTITLLILAGAFLVYATKKKWISWRGGRGIATLTAFHDLQTSDKQDAIEYVMDEKAGKKMEEEDTSGPKQ